MSKVGTPSWIVFDVGGVLLDWHTSSNAAATHLGLTHDELFDVIFDLSLRTNIGDRMHLGELTPHEGWTMVLKTLKKEHAPAEIINRWFAQEYWLEDTLRLVTELHAKGYNLAILSNSWLGMSNPEYNHLLPRELGLFDKLFDSSEIHLQKPDVAIYTFVETNLGVSGEELFFIDDTKENIDIAAQRGWSYFLYTMANDQGISANNKLRERLLGSTQS